MATLVRQPQRWLVVAETDEERELCASGRARGDHLTLEDAVYPVDGDSVVLPASLSEGAATRLCKALRRAARSHADAQVRRHRLRLL